MAKGNSLSKTAIWVLMGFLILGLGGFGATNLSGTIRTLGTVGDKHIDIDQYARQLSQEMRAAQADSGQPLRFAQAQAMGIDRAVLQRLVQTRALDHEVTQLGLSIGDETLRNQILDIPAFRGIDGKFDREGYAYSLEQSGLSEAQFEIRLREEAARTLLQGSIAAGVVMPDTYARTLVNYVAESRDFTWARLTSENLEAPLEAITEAEQRAFHSENQSEFQIPETKKITYTLLLPDMLVDQVTLEDSALQAEYDVRLADYRKPERRLVERLPFLDDAAADQAAAALEVSGTTFEALVEERGLALADVDLGDVSRLELDAAGEAVFTAEIGDVVGPLPSAIGPALFRVNAVLPAQNTSFEDAKPELKARLAADRARRLVDIEAQELDTLLAGGATLEELANESDMTLASVDWYDGTIENIAGYSEFRAAATAVTVEDFPEIKTLSDGGIFALRLDEVIPERDATFEEAREDVVARMESERLEAALRAQAEALEGDLSSGKTFAEAGLDSTVETDQVRNSFIQGTPAGFMAEVFEMAPGDVRIVTSFGSVIILRLEAVNPASENPDATALQEQLSAQMNQSLAQNLLQVFSTDVTLRAGPQVDQRALQAVHVNFP